MDETDGWLISIALAALGVMFGILAVKVRQLEADVGIIRLTQTTPISRKDSGQ